jgi:hypothetical protein
MDVSWEIRSFGQRETSMVIFEDVFVPLGKGLSLRRNAVLSQASDPICPDSPDDLRRNLRGVLGLA